MEEFRHRLEKALAREEIRAERLAGAVRFGFLALLTVIAALNIGAVSRHASAMNFGVLGIGWGYSLAVVLLMRRFGYRSIMKYVTSLMDVGLVLLLLGLYASIDIPSVALKNYVFLVLFPIIALTAFRFDPRLTLFTGTAAAGLYALLIAILVSTGRVSLVHGGYDRELFSPDVTIVGQATKLVLLALFVLLVAYQTRYTRRLISTLVEGELTSRQAREALDWEMRLAGSVQQQFLPHDLPSVPGVTFAGSVRQGRAIGGDYYDFVPIRDGGLLVIVADVSGKGAPAALIMAEVRAAVQVLAQEFRGLADLAERLNMLIHRSTDRKTFVTMLAVEIVPSQGTLSYVCAGHLPPVLVSHGEAQTLARGSMPLGVSAPLPGVRVQTVDFRPGDLLICCTDGILEHTDPAGEQFGDDRLRAFASQNASLEVTELIRQLNDAVRAFGDGRDPDDDATVAVVRATAT